ncbi:hypothetical protein Pelo_12724 [Pelomyxa schiedti]|nr:hypothetical protein Pelo_12724 [Pelomyxa schiedti]
MALAPGLRLLGERILTETKMATGVPKVTVSDLFSWVEEDYAPRFISPTPTSRPPTIFLPGGEKRFLTFEGISNPSLWNLVEELSPLLYDPLTIKEPGIYAWILYVHSDLCVGTKHAAIYKRLMDKGCAQPELSPVIVAGELLVESSGVRKYNFSSGTFMLGRYDDNEPSIENDYLAPWASTTVFTGDWTFEPGYSEWMSDLLPKMSLIELMWLSDNGVELRLYEDFDVATLTSLYDRRPALKTLHESAIVALELAIAANKDLESRILAVQSAASSQHHHHHHQHHHQHQATHGAHLVDTNQLEAELRETQQLLQLQQLQLLHHTPPYATFSRSTPNYVQTQLLG